MKVHKNAIIVFAVISIVALITGFATRYLFVSTFLYDLCIGIFTGAIVALFLSIVEYRVKRLETLESFYINAIKHIKEISKMDESLTIDQKIDGYLELINNDLPDLGTDYAKIDFIYDKDNSNKNYIYNSIYKPIDKLENTISKRHFHFTSHKNGSVRNYEAMSIMINEIEDIIFSKEKFNHKEMQVDIIENEFCNKIHRELDGRYYAIMYPKNLRDKIRKLKDK